MTLMISFRDALEFRHRLGLPSAAIVEGINDFLRVDFQTYRYLPYRRCSHVYLAGEADSDYFADRPTAIVGMPIVESLAQKEPAFPDPPLVAINVNFTYGCLEEARDLFVESAVRGCQLAGVSYSMTQHPADSGDLGQHPVTDGTQYQLIDACSVFVSRFATGIIESLASGKPAIYFNPHDERVGKFRDPMGAFGVATTSEALASEIASVLADIDRGVDFRERALPFLQRHAAFMPGQSSGDRFKDAVASTLSGNGDPAATVSGPPSPPLLGPFPRDRYARVNETEVVAALRQDCFGQEHVLLDIGAHFGASLEPFAKAEWTVIACEPDSRNRQTLIDRFGDRDNVSVVPHAVSDEPATDVTLYSSSESAGISSLHPFHRTHREADAVDVTTVAHLVETACRGSTSSR